MNELIEFLTSKEVILVYCIAGLLCFVCLIVYVVEKNNDRRRRRHNTKELNKLVEQVKDEVSEVNEDTIVYDEPVLENIAEAYTVDEMIENSVDAQKEEAISMDVSVEVKDDSIEELEYTSIEPDQETARFELKKLEEQLILEEKKKEEEEMLSCDVPVLEDRNIKLTVHEEKQEADAIISLDELLSRGKELYDANEITQYEDEGNEPISIQDLEYRMKKNDSQIEVCSIDDEKEEISEINEVKSVGDIRIEPKFKSSPIISPIFGIEGINNESVNELELENTANYEKLDQEIKKTNEFLMTLKELQNKLE